MHSETLIYKEYLSASKDTVTPIFIKCKDFMETNPKLSHHGKNPLPSGYFKVNSVFIDCRVNLYCKINNKYIKKTNWVWYAFVFILYDVNKFHKLLHVAILFNICNILHFLWSSYFQKTDIFLHAMSLASTTDVI